VACNTASAAAIDDLRQSCPVEVVDVIRPGAAAAVEQTDGPIGVIATEATIASGAYQRAIAELDPSRQVMAVACPLLVPIVEEGRADDDPIVVNVLCDYLRDMQRWRPSAMILGCTHYPLLKGAIGKLMGPPVTLVNSGWAAAREVHRRLRGAGLEAGRQRPGRLRCFTTDNPQRFTAWEGASAGGTSTPWNSWEPTNWRPGLSRQCHDPEMLNLSRDLACTWPAGDAGGRVQGRRRTVQAG